MHIMQYNKHLDDAIQGFGYPAAQPPIVYRAESENLDNAHKARLGMEFTDLNPITSRLQHPLIVDDDRGTPPHIFSRIDHGTPPSIPVALQQYNSYVEDPKWQIRFTLMWCSVLSLGVVLAAPRVVRGLLTGAAFAGVAGVRVAALYAPLASDDDRSSTQSTIVGDIKMGTGRVGRARRNWVYTAASLLSSFALWSIPGIGLNLGQLLMVMAYSAFTLVSIIRKAPLMSNPNRAGFMALAQLPPVFLFAMKNSPVALLLGPGVDYTKLNYLHRWAGRGLFIGAVIHGALWIQNHLTYKLPILTQQKEASGVAALAVLFIIGLSSVGPLRRWCYSLSSSYSSFLTFPAFFVTICYHTPFASPWIIPPVAFYAFDVLLRLLKFRVVVAPVRACEGGISVVRLAFLLILLPSVPANARTPQISIPAAATGWRAGQHVQVRILLGGGSSAQAHPLTILCAPPDTTCLVPPPGLLLAARACGRWSRALHAFGSEAADSFTPGAESVDTEEDDAATGRAVHAILDGPYGGPTLDAGTYGAVLFLAGGSGATATLGTLDDLVGRCVRRGRASGERTRRVEWVWCVRDADALTWFAPQLAQIAAMAARPGSGLALRIRVFLTGSGTSVASGGPDWEVCVGRPIVRTLLDELVDSDEASSVGSVKDAEHGTGAGEEEEDMRCSRRGRADSCAKRGMLWRG
ncbi:iron reductase [Mycena leptocephala]|nr:iron reductase [Mycena leptocephala]